LSILDAAFRTKPTILSIINLHAKKIKGKENPVAIFGLKGQESLLLMAQTCKYLLHCAVNYKLSQG
jgi:hypothetical protein